MLKRLGTCCQIGAPVNDKFTKLTHTAMGGYLPSHMKIIGSGYHRDVLNPKKRAKSYWLTTVYNALEHDNDWDTLAFYKIQDKALSNCSALLTQLQEVATWSPDLRFFRISSDLLPLFDHPDFHHLYTDALKDDIRAYLAECKAVIDQYDIRVSVHPGAWNIVNTYKESTIKGTIPSLLYHKWFMEQLTSPEAGAVINIHANGEAREIPCIDQLDALGITPWLSFENDDISAKGTTELTLELCERYGIRCVFDIHHHYVQTGEWITPYHPLVRRALNTWGDKRPKVHFSQARFPDAESKRQKCQHADMIDSPVLVEVARLYLEHTDIMVEAKYKSHATHTLMESLL